MYVSYLQSLDGGQMVDRLEYKYSANMFVVNVNIVVVVGGGVPFFRLLLCTTRCVACRRCRRSRGGSGEEEKSWRSGRRKRCWGSDRV